MTFFAFILIVLSAGLHASWNLVAKKNHITVAFYTLLCTAATIFWLHVQFWTPFPWSQIPPKFWIFLALSVSSDILYCHGLVWSYRKLEMATAYPVMRALPIILTALITSAAGWGKPLNLAALAGFFVVFCGSLLMPLDNWKQLKFSNYINSGMLFVFVVACGTTGYTIFDSLAQQTVTETAPELPGAIRSLSYYSTRSIALTCALWTFCVLPRAKNRNDLKEFIAKRNFAPLLAGVIASGCYVLVLWAMNFVTNVSYVQVFRQLGLPIGMAMGIVILKERSALTKWVGVSLILFGLCISVLK